MPRFEQIDVFTDKLLLGTRWRSCTMPMPSTKIRCLRAALDEPFGDDVAYANAQGLCDSDHGLSREGTVMYERRRGERNANHVSAHTHSSYDALLDEDSRLT